MSEHQALQKLFVQQNAEIDKLKNQIDKLTDENFLKQTTIETMVDDYVDLTEKHNILITKYSILKTKLLKLFEEIALDK